MLFEIIVISILGLILVCVSFITVVAVRFGRMFIEALDYDPEKENENGTNNK